MFRRTLFALAAAAVAVAIVASAEARSSSTRLVGTVGPGYTITLKKGTTKVTKLKAGKYKIVIRDLSNLHDFHLTGPGVNKKTGVTAKGTFTWTVTLKKGAYKFICDPHAAIMKGSFKVT